MTTQALERMVDSSFAPSFTQDRMYHSIDTFANGTTGLFTPPVRIYDFPASGTQLHIHASRDHNTIFGGGFKKYGEDKIFHPMNGYDLAIADHNLSTAGIKPIILPKI